jgi:hypothetical protein
MFDTLDLGVKHRGHGQAPRFRTVATNVLDCCENTKELCEAMNKLTFLGNPPHK